MIDAIAFGAPVILLLAGYLLVSRHVTGHLALTRRITTDHLLRLFDPGSWRVTEALGAINHLVVGFYYVPLALCCVGLTAWDRIRHHRRVNVFLLALLAAFLVSSISFSLVGYANRKHGSPYAVLLLPWVAVGGSQLRYWGRRFCRYRPGLSAPRQDWARADLIAVLVVCALLLPKTLKPTTWTRLPERLAGEWIRLQAEADWPKVIITGFRSRCLVFGGEGGAVGASFRGFL